MHVLQDINSDKTIAHRSPVYESGNNPFGQGVHDISTTKRVVEIRLFSYSVRRCELRKNITITLLIIALCASLYLLLHSRDSPTITSIGVGNISIIGNIDKININTASPQALESLPGIGNVLAGRIISGRPYDDLYALDKVKGIGPKTIKGLEGRVVTE